MRVHSELNERLCSLPCGEYKVCFSDIFPTLIQALLFDTFCVIFKLTLYHNHRFIL